MSPSWSAATAGVLTATAMLALAACAKHSAHGGDAVTPTPAPVAARPTVDASPRASTGPVATGAPTTARAAPVQLPAAGTPPPPSAFHAVAELRDIHFDFDRYDIRPEERVTLEANVRWLRLHPDRLVLIEGHCDPRGTAVYNLSLGDRRAKAIVAHLLTQGVAAARITTISYGEERPLCDAAVESCWASNRRAHFLVNDQ